MTLPAPTYDLVLLLDLQAEEDARRKIVADARASIEAQGELLRHDDWGERALTYPIEKKANAEYHLLQFHAGASALLDGLDRTLRLTDGVMRFRIIKLAPGVPDAPAMAAAPAVAAPPAQPEQPAAMQPAAAAPAAEAPAAPAAVEAPAAEPAPFEAPPAESAAVEAPAVEPAAVETPAAGEPEAQPAAEASVGESA